MGGTMLTVERAEQRPGITELLCTRETDSFPALSGGSQVVLDQEGGNRDVHRASGGLVRSWEA